MATGFAVAALGLLLLSGADAHGSYFSDVLPGMLVAGLGLGVRGVTASPLPGPSGNVEFFLWLTRGAPPLDDAALSAAVEAGPQ